MTLQLRINSRDKYARLILFRKENRKENRKAILDLEFFEASDFIKWAINSNFGLPTEHFYTKDNNGFFLRTEYCWEWVGGRSECDSQTFMELWAGCIFEKALQLERKFLHE